MFITDTRSGESPFLDESSIQPLVFKTLEGEVAAVIPTDKPWNHERLSAINLDAVLGPDYASHGFDAYVGDAWVGSTEV